MNVKKVKRKCNVRGCRCTDTFAISLTREMGNSIIVCRSCLEKALNAISKKYGQEGNQIKKNDSVVEQIESAEPEKNTNSYVCPYCGKKYGTERGLKQHIKSCDKKPSDE